LWNRDEVVGLGILANTEDLVAAMTWLKERES
jgi:hypothetical protein